MRNLAHVLFGLSLLSACTTDNIQHQQDNGVGSPDMGSPDMWVLDPLDAGPEDTGAPQDLGSPDMGTQDMGTACDLHVAPSALVFGSVLLGQTKLLTVLVSNIGFQDCAISNTQIVSSEFALAGASPPPGLLGPGGAFEVIVRFSPTSAGIAQTNLLIESDDALEPTIEVPLSGTGTPIEIPSNQTITVNVNNTLAAPVYVATQGMFCTTFDVGEPISLGWQCGCECPAPPAAAVIEMRRVDPGQSYIFTWDARVIDVHNLIVACNDGPDIFKINEVQGVPRPAASGQRTIQVAYELSLPSNCTEDTNGDVWCSNDFTGETPPAVAGLCASTNVASQSFTLMSGVDQTVDVMITP